MLSPESAFSRIIIVITLLALIALLAVRAIRKGRTEFQRFKRFERTRNRQRMLRKWLLESFLIFGGSAAVILIVAAQYVPLFLAAVHRWPVSLWFRATVDASDGLIPGIAIGLAGLVVAGTILAVYLVRATAEIPTIGDISALLPRNRPELVLGTALSMNAGIVEELLFRLAMPVLLFGATGSALLAVVVSIALFGALHLYQGLPGIIGASVIGIFLMVLYLATGSILVAIITHALIDLRSLVLIPILVFGVHRTRS